MIYVVEMRKNLTLFISPLPRKIKILPKKIKILPRKGKNYPERAKTTQKISDIQFALSKL